MVVDDSSASPDRGAEGQPDPDGVTEDVRRSERGALAGTELGGRYRIRSRIGAGGLGEVWHAVDLKLKVDVALKALRPELLGSQRRLELLRQEVRAAREVVSPNVCRIFDLIEADGRELVSMEYIDGQTLLDVLRERGPLELKQAQDIASQFLSGLEAIHRAGLVHRDVKPENIMLTRAGRVVVMDFGLARQESEGGSSVSGTPAYMAPEQAAGDAVDARADVYSAGVVLAEMVSPGGVRELESRKSLWQGVRREPPQLPDSPWAPVIRKAVARDREDRYHTAHTLTRALEDVTLRVEGAEDLHPYPGLASFTEADAEYFFGRETEVEAFWARLDRPQLLAIVGPSGAGKTSFIRAGVLPAAPGDWARVVCTPGTAAMASLARPMARELAGDAELMERLLSFDDPDVAVEVYSTWRRKHPQALLVVDQFEELFTLNPPETQARVAELLGRLVLEADVCVVLSLRDDFLMRCRDLDALRPIFSELTALPTLAGPELRRALVQPATTCGYRFEDDELVEQMLAEVEDERGALPMLAFAAARLWERRDRDNGLLTRQAHRDIGGVGGALARHAEATIDRVGADRVPIVRELLRNLVTAEGTRAVRAIDELLSVFDDDDRAAAEETLGELVDARLLTTYEIHGEGQEPARQVEIVHESLLDRWPRLVRWQTQDADAAQLRDQLRQAARTWEEHGRSDDLLWSRSAYREYAVWRESYPGGLSETEQAFGEAMTRHALRRRRRRRAAIATTFAVLLTVLAVVATLWQRSVRETRRAEAAKLVSLGRVALVHFPTKALAFAVASLELDDTPEVRRLALEALWRGPTELQLPSGSPFCLDFSPDGRWLLTAHPGEGALLWPLDGGPPTPLEEGATTLEGRISPRGDVVAFNTSWTSPTSLALWSLPDGRFLRTLDTGGYQNQNFSFSREGDRLIAATEFWYGETVEVLVRSWPLAGGEPDLLARLELPRDAVGQFFGVDPAETMVAWIEGAKVKIRPLGGPGGDSTPAVELEHGRPLATAIFDPEGRKLAVCEPTGRTTVYALDRDPPAPLRICEAKGYINPFAIRFNPSGTMLGTGDGFLCDLTAAPDAGPLSTTSVSAGAMGTAFHPNGRWFANSHPRSVSLWSLSHPYPQVLRGHESYVTHLDFTPDGWKIVSGSEAGRARIWPLDPESGEHQRVVFDPPGLYDAIMSRAVAPDGSFVAFGTWEGRLRLVPLDGGPERELDGFTDEISALAVGPRSRLVAAGGSGIVPEEAVVRIWDLESGETRVLDNGDGKHIGRLDFTSDGDLWVASRGVGRRWDLRGAEPRVVEEVDVTGEQFVSARLLDFHPDRRRLLLLKPPHPWVHDLDTGKAVPLPDHDWPTECIFDATGDVVLSANERGDVRVSRATGGHTHLLLGHGYCLKALAASPDGRWVASGGCDRTIRVWPMPDLSKRPLHALPRRELLAKLETFTNMRVVRDDSTATGWRWEFGPFPGWETVPTW
jgi:WD40 repeat protein